VATGYLSPNAGYIPNWEASGKIIVDFSRNPGDFALPKYVQYVKTPKKVGYFLQITPDNSARILNTDLSEFRWPDGQPRPMGNDNSKDFQFVKFSTDRYAFPYTLGDLTIDQTDWDIVAMHARMAAQQAMTGRALRVLTLATTGGNWPTAHTATATVAGGGKWDVAMSTTPFIKKSLMTAAIQINKDTLGVVKPKDLHLVINPTLASLMASSQEIIDQVKQAANTINLIRGEDRVNNVGGWLLPDVLYGFPVVIEDTVRVSTHRGTNTQTIGYEMADTVALLMARVGGLDGLYGAPSFSTAQVFMHEEMTVETFDDTLNRRTIGSVVENYVEALVSTASGFLFTACSG
jgi:hypothetical protein